LVFDAPAPLTHCAERPRRAFAMLEFTGGTQTTDAAFDAAFGFAPGVLALLLPAVICAQIWHQRLTHGGSSRIRALAPRRQPMRPGALPFLHRALVLLASLAMLPCTSAHGVAHPGESLETLDCHSAYYSSGGVGACDTYGCTADDHTAGYGCCCSTLRLDPASHAGVVHYVLSDNQCYKITVGTSIEQRFAAPSSPPGAVTATSDDQCRTAWGSLLVGQNSLGSMTNTNAIKTQSYAGGTGSRQSTLRLVARRYPSAPTTAMVTESPMHVYKFVLFIAAFAPPSPPALPP
jgi:hypothetical protein